MEPHSAGLYPAVVGVTRRGVKDSPSWFVLVSFNTFLDEARLGLVGCDGFKIRSERVDGIGRNYRRRLCVHCFDEKASPR